MMMMDQEVENVNKEMEIIKIHHRILGIEKYNN